MAASETTPGGNRNAPEDETTEQGPSTPRGPDDLDAPSPPGGPLRRDAPAGTVPPGGPGTPAQPGEPKEVERPHRPVKEPGSDTDPDESVLTGDDNAQTSQGEPSDDSGSE